MKIGKLFKNQEMTWKKVIIFAVASAVLTAVLKLIPVLEDTSFQDIAINLECWILFAMFIIVNCKKWQEATIKTFVFFLISQPLIYLIQVPFSSFGFQLFDYYRYWFVLTVLTLPGAFIAYQVKRKNWLSVLVLSVATAFLGYMAADYFWTVKAAFPHHVLSMCFCVVLAFFLIFTLLEDKVHRVVASAVVVVSLVAALIILKPINAQMVLLGDGNWTYTVNNPDVVEAVIEKDNSVIFTAKGEGTSDFIFIDENGNTIEYIVTVSGGGIYINEME